MLPNPKHEAFARGIFEGKSQEQAYIDAGYSGKGARQSSSKLLLTNPDILLRVAELQNKVTSSAIWTKADALNKLADLHVKFAAQSEPASGNVARSCIMDYAKLAGWVVDKSEAEVTQKSLPAKLEDFL